MCLLILRCTEILNVFTATAAKPGSSPRLDMIVFCSFELAIFLYIVVLLNGFCSAGSNILNFVVSTTRSLAWHSGSLLATFQRSLTPLADTIVGIDVA